MALVVTYTPAPQAPQTVAPSANDEVEDNPSPSLAVVGDASINPAAQEEPEEVPIPSAQITSAAVISFGAVQALYPSESLMPSESLTPTEGVETAGFYADEPEEGLDPTLEHSSADTIAQHRTDEPEEVSAPTLAALLASITVSAPDPADNAEDTLAPSISLTVRPPSALEDEAGFEVTLSYATPAFATPAPAVEDEEGLRPFLFAGRIEVVGRPEEARLLSTLTGERGAVVIRTRFYRSNISGEKVSEFGGVMSAVVQMSNFRETAWTLSMELDKNLSGLFPGMPGTDMLEEYVMPVIEVLVDGQWLEFPQGLYLMRLPKRQHEETFSAYAYEGESLETILLADFPEDGYEVAAGTGCLEAVRDILTDRGVAAHRINFPSTDKFLSSTMTWEISADGQESSHWLGISNAILSAGGFYSLKTTAAGLFYTRDIEDLSARGADVAYGPQFEPMLLAPVNDDFEDVRFANKVVVISTDVEQEPPIVAVAENHDPNSPASRENLGRWETAEPYRLGHIVSQVEAAALARGYLQARSSLYRKLQLSTLTDPRRDVQEVYELGWVRSHDREDEEILEGTWSVINRSQSLGDPPGLTTHEVSRIEQI
jgi:hypothetical protein